MAYVEELSLVLVGEYLVKPRKTSYGVFDAPIAFWKSRFQMEVRNHVIPLDITYLANLLITSTKYCVEISTLGQHTKFYRCPTVHGQGLVSY